MSAILVILLPACNNQALPEPLDLRVTVHSNGSVYAKNHLDLCKHDLNICNFLRNFNLIVFPSPRLADFF